jgi:FkbM family methyltransferase
MHIDLAREKFYWLGTHEVGAQPAIPAHVRRGSVVYDIGAHAGFFTLLLSRLTGDDGRVLAFEPDAENAARLQTNIAANGCANVDVCTLAMSDVTGTGRLALGRLSLQGALAEVDDPISDGAKVPVTTIDALIEDGALPPSFIKVDVDGAEGRVIAGARRTIAQNRPAMLIKIYSPAAWGEVLDALPVAYGFIDVDATRYSAKLRMPGHYIALPVVQEAR